MARTKLGKSQVCGHYMDMWMADLDGNQYEDSFHEWRQQHHKCNECFKKLGPPGKLTADEWENLMRDIHPGDVVEVAMSCGCEDIIYIPENRAPRAYVRYAIERRMCSNCWDIRRKPASREQRSHIATHRLQGRNIPVADNNDDAPKSRNTGFERSHFWW